MRKQKIVRNNMKKLNSDNNTNFIKRGSRRPRERDSRFDKRESGRFGRRYPGKPSRKSEQQIMHEVTCNKCGKKCEVPFKPTPGKPVYCNECFREKEDFRSKNRPNEFAREFDQINKKLDKILEAIEVD